MFHCLAFLVQIPCDDEYIVIDHVFDPLTGGRGRLLTPVVLKIRQEQMIQLYGLQFQRVPVLFTVTLTQGSTKYFNVRVSGCQ